MKRPRQQRAEATRQKILDAAEELFNERGYEKTSMNALAEAAQVSIGGLYEWLRNKEQVLTAVAERHMDVATTRILERLADSVDLDMAAQIKIVLEEGLSLHRAKPQLHRFLYSEAPRPPQLQAKLRAFDAQLEQTLTKHLQGQGLSKGKAELQAAIVARTGQALLHQFVLDEELPFSYEHRLEALHKTLCDLMQV